MSNQFWVSNANSPSQGAGSALASSTTLTDISPLPQWVFPYYPYAGQRVRVTAYGVFSSGTPSPTLLLAVYFGGAAAGTSLGNCGSVSALIGAANWPWDLSFNFNVRTIGSSGSAWGQGKANIGTSLAAFASYAVPSTAINPVTINTSTLQTLTVAAQWGSASTSNTITCEDLIVELMN